MKFRIHLLSLLFFVLPVVSTAQNWGGRGGGGGGNQAMRALQQQSRAQQSILTGNVYLIEEDSEQLPGVGVTVIVVSDRGEGEKADTTFAVSGQNGVFTIRNLKPGSAMVTFSMLGYEEQTNPITLVQGQNRVIASLRAESITLEGAVIKEVANPVSIKEDTIAFHASAVNPRADARSGSFRQWRDGAERECQHGIYRRCPAFR